ncbi:PilW family protein, partial [Cycloclasticus pugetii]
MTHPKTQTAQCGITLVELMIAMVIGLLLAAGISQVFVSSQQTY